MTNNDNLSEEVRSNGTSADLGGQYGSGVRSMMKAAHWAFVLMVLMIFALLVYFFTLGGYFAVSPQEAVIVLRFGKYENTYTSDWHWFLPDPVTKRVVIPTNPQTLQVSFNALIDPKNPPAPGADGSLPGLKPERDRYLLTADGNIIHASWSIRYQIEDPALYFQSVRVPAKPAGPDEIVVENGEELGRRGPHTLLARILEDAIIRTTAKWKVDDILYAKQTEYRGAVESCCRKLVEEMNIGVSVEEVRINGKVMTPLVTQFFFDQLTAARAEQGTMIDKAREYKVSTEAAAKEESSRIVAAAENYRTMTVVSAKARSRYFESFLKEYKSNPRTALMSRYNAVLAEVLSGIEQKYILGTGNSDRKVWMKLGPELPKRDSAAEAASAAEVK